MVLPVIEPWNFRGTFGVYLYPPARARARRLRAKLRNHHMTPVP